MQPVTHSTLTVFERAEFFRTEFAKLVQQYDIREDRAAGTIDAQRISHLVSILIIKLFGGHIGQDAECAFFEWAKANGLQCKEIPELEWHRGKRVISPYPPSYRRIFGKISFSQYFRMAEQVIKPAKEPVFRKEPVVWLARTTR